jgi:regulator of replication initiation timing
MDLKEFVLKMTDESIELKAENERLKKELSLLCPIADLPVIESLKVDKLALMEQISEKEREIQMLYGKLNMIQDILNQGISIKGIMKL